MVAALGHLTRVIAGIPVPNTPIVNATISYAQANLPTATYKHVMRSWLNGQAIINKFPSANLANVDQDAHAVAAILHDMGFSNNTQLLSHDKRFEVDGADDTARSFLQREGGKEWSEARQQAVWDGIALHGIPNIALHRDFFVALVAAGSQIDLAGPEGAKLVYGDMITVTREEYDGIQKEFPFSDGDRPFFVEQLVELCRSKPDTTYDNYVGDFGERYVANYSRVGHRAIDFMDYQSSSG
ncbi:hypothetical protein DM02DRAFT_584009 [Periconia macrospinosa]|uniref:HD domain-containing protein n=1 Tax=Periconia macrospinosa TaxID=97972 RepID=A0A2V1E4W0_9PLEO|nr:hypothetical protein DM02DRAFT_584009 [Periconia macrospinosa]